MDEKFVLYTCMCRDCASSHWVPKYHACEDSPSGLYFISSRILGMDEKFVLYTIYNLVKYSTFLLWGHFTLAIVEFVTKEMEVFCWDEY